MTFFNNQEQASVINTVSMAGMKFNDNCTQELYARNTVLKFAQVNALATFIKVTKEGEDQIEYFKIENDKYNLDMKLKSRHALSKHIPVVKHPLTYKQYNNCIESLLSVTDDKTGNDLTEFLQSFITLVNKDYLFDCSYEDKLFELNMECGAHRFSFELTIDIH